MPLVAAGLADAIKTEINSSQASPPREADLDPFCLAIGTAIVSYLTANGLVIIPASAIVTLGDASTQTGPALPVNLSIT